MTALNASMWSAFELPMFIRQSELGVTAKKKKKKNPSTCILHKVNNPNSNPNPKEAVEDEMASVSRWIYWIIPSFVVLIEWAVVVIASHSSATIMSLTRSFVTQGFGECKCREFCYKTSSC